MEKTMVKVDKYFIEVGTDLGFVYKATAHDVEADTYHLTDEMLGGSAWTKLTNGASVMVEMDKFEYDCMMDLNHAAAVKMDEYRMDRLEDYKDHLLNKYQ